jgi:hypothetical protein
MSHDRDDGLQASGTRAAIEGCARAVAPNANAPIVTTNPMAHRSLMMPSESDVDIGWACERGEWGLVRDARRREVENDGQQSCHAQCCQAQSATASTWGRRRRAMGLGASDTVANLNANEVSNRGQRIILH